MVCEASRPSEFDTERFVHFSRERTGLEAIELMLKRAEATREQERSKRRVG